MICVACHREVTDNPHVCQPTLWRLCPHGERITSHADTATHSSRCIPCRREIAELGNAARAARKAGSRA